MENDNEELKIEKYYAPLKELISRFADINEIPFTQLVIFFCTSLGDAMFALQFTEEQASIFLSTILESYVEIKRKSEVKIYEQN